MLYGNFIQSILPYKHKEYVTISSFSVEWQRRKKFWGWSATFSIARDRKGFFSFPHHWPELARSSHFPWSVEIRELSKLATTTLTATWTAKKAVLISDKQLWTCNKLFFRFLCRHYTTTTWNSLTGRFMEVVNATRPCFLPTFILGFSLQEFNSRKLQLQTKESFVIEVLKGHFKRVGIIATNLEKLWKKSF